ncbi:hypothetical protein MUK42_21586 [Musa troglodytarum]|uniref:Callose synthase 9 n=1 Tax=Musa troglodytarum TaxID=320322 RepID=A0A9E7K4W4_9LILI|nr:hypothetical protein MUK42_21586 [Musa troglodytarum]
MVIRKGMRGEMPTPEANWERLVRAALRGERLGVGAFGQPVSGVAGNVPSCLANNTHIDDILRAADEIEDEDRNISRILCEHAYSLAQNLDPNSEGRGVLQFKTGLMSVIKQKLAKKDGGGIDRSQDIAYLQEFYKRYREKYKVDELHEDEMKLRESGVFSGNLGELEKKTVKRKKVFATLRVLGTVLEDLTREIAPDDAAKIISEEMKRVMEKDAAMTEDIIAYNIIPLDVPSIANVKAAISSLKCYTNLPKLPSDFPVPAARGADVLDLLQYVFGFQKDNVSNQREHVVHLLANEQSRFGSIIGSEPKIDETAVNSVFKKSLENYTKWCNYLPLQPVWNNIDNISREKKLLFVSLYFLIWGEAANIRSLRCLKLNWPWNLSSPFFLKPNKKKMGLTIIAFNGGKLNWKTIKQVLSLGPTKALQDGSNSAAFRIFVFIVGIYAAFKLFIGFLVRIPFCHHLTDLCYRWPVIRLVKWLHQIKPLVTPTKTIVNFKDLQYSWHDLVSRILLFNVSLTSHAYGVA